MREQNEEYARPAQPPDTSSLATMRGSSGSLHCVSFVFDARSKGPRDCSSIIASCQPDEESREREYKHFVSDLRSALRAAGEE
jgi:hypothetical protein